MSVPRAPSTRGRNRRLRAGAGLVIAVTAVAGCTAGNPADPAPALSFPGSVSTGAGISQGRVRAGGAVTFGSIIVCGSRAGTRLESVTLSGVVGDIAVSSFAVRPNPATSGGRPIGVTDEPLTSAMGSTAAIGPGEALPCGGDARGSEVLVETAHTGVADGCARGGFDLHYTSGSGRGTLHVPLALAVGQGDRVACP